MSSFVGIIMGSKSDYKFAENTIEVLKEYEIPFEVIIASAHRSPDRVKEYIISSEKKGAKIFICMAGMAAHLAGAIAGLTTKPVIGVPLKGGSMDGLDAMLSTVQMPAGIPVATVALGNAGAKNSAHLAAQILSLNDESITNKIIEIRENAKKNLIKNSKEIEVII
jgi:5-(carboxyamino)imidazole ribonucleotide mutase